VWGDLIVLGYAGAVGFVAAGITSSFYRMITAEPARFGFFGETALALVTTVVFCALTGPVIIMERAIVARRLERSPIRWFAMGTLIAAIWSCCLGLLVLEIVLAVQGNVA